MIGEVFLPCSCQWQPVVDTISDKNNRPVSFPDNNMLKSMVRRKRLGAHWGIHRGTGSTFLPELLHWADLSNFLTPDFRLLNCILLPRFDTSSKTIGNLYFKSAERGCWRYSHPRPHGEVYRKMELDLDKFTQILWNLLSWSSYFLAQCYSRYSHWTL